MDEGARCRIAGPGLKKRRLRKRCRYTVTRDPAALQALEVVRARLHAGVREAPVFHGSCQASQPIKPEKLQPLNVEPLSAGSLDIKALDVESLDVKALDV